jgi:hypothetical protein
MESKVAVATISSCSIKEVWVWRGAYQVNDHPNRKATALQSILEVFKIDTYLGFIFEFSCLKGMYREIVARQIELISKYVFTILLRTYGHMVAYRGYTYCCAV